MSRFCETYPFATEPGNILCHDKTVVDPAAQNSLQPGGEDGRGLAHARDDNMTIVGKPVQKGATCMPDCKGITLQRE